MSVATEFPPTVYIPDSARPTGRPGPGAGRSRHLALVATPVVTTAAGFGISAGLASPPRRFGDSSVAWPLTVEPTAAPLRLTRRGVVALVVATLALGLLLLAVAWASSSAGSDPASVAAMPLASSVVVQPGDTLWSIAQRAEPGHDPRLVIDHLRHLNHLNSAALTPGQTLKLR